MDHLTKTQLFIGALIFIACVVLALRAFVRHLRRLTAPFRDYFGPEYDRDLLQQSELSENDEWRADRHPSFTPFRLRNYRANERR